MWSTQLKGRHMRAGMAQSQTRSYMWVKFVGSRLCSERFFSGYSDFPFSSKNQPDELI